MSLRGILRGPAAPAIVAVCVIAAMVESRSEQVERATEEPPPRAAEEEAAATAETLALLSGLEPGDVVGGDWHVVAVRGPTEGHVAVRMERRGSRLEVRIVRKGTSDANAPLTSERFDFFYVTPSWQAPITRESLQAGVRGVRDRIAEDVEIPPGM